MSDFAAAQAIKLAEEQLECCRGSITRAGSYYAEAKKNLEKAKARLDELYLQENALAHTLALLRKDYDSTR